MMQPNQQYSQNIQLQNMQLQNMQYATIQNQNQMIMMDNFAQPNLLRTANF